MGRVVGLSGDIITVAGNQYEILSKGSGPAVTFSRPIPVGTRYVSTKDKPVYLYPTPENPKGVPQQPGEVVVWDKGRISSLPEGTKVRTESGAVRYLQSDGKWTSTKETAPRPPAQPAPSKILSAPPPPPAVPAITAILPTAAPLLTVPPAEAPNGKVVAPEPVAVSEPTPANGKVVTTTTAPEVETEAPAGVPVWVWLIGGGVLLYAFSQRR
jgi:hypothetical protein